jgi:molybdopterin-guanine dinucleotide biosynthesis protein B
MAHAFLTEKIVKRIHIIGRKNSGKTTLVVDLVRRLTAQGRRVGTIKHTRHHHELDTPGKDSYLHRQAGAAAVGILSPDMNAVFWPAQTDEDPHLRYRQMLTQFSNCELVLVEGHSQMVGPKVEVWRAAVTEAPLAASDPSILAVVTDDAVDVSVPCWPRSNLDLVAARLWELAE